MASTQATETLAYNYRHNFVLKTAGDRKDELSVPGTSHSGDGASKTTPAFKLL